MSISDKELQALRNLSKKQAGEDVDFINIADARALTELGLALRTQQGWVITDAGTRLLSGEGGSSAAPEAPTSITPFPPKTT
jgi:hypothetical protein